MSDPIDWLGAAGPCEDSSHLAVLSCLPLHPKPPAPEYPGSFVLDLEHSQLQDILKESILQGHWGGNVAEPEPPCWGTLGRSVPQEPLLPQNCHLSSAALPLSNVQPALPPGNCSGNKAHEYPASNLVVSTMPPSPLSGVSVKPQESYVSQVLPNSPPTQACLPRSS